MVAGILQIRGKKKKKDWIIAKLKILFDFHSSNIKFTTAENQSS